MSILPDKCPTCYEHLYWSDTGVDLFCLNKECNSRVIRKLLHFFHLLNNLDGFGPKTIENLIENKYDSIPKIYNMSFQDLEYCGYKHKTIINLGSELQESKRRPIQDYRFIAALGIPSLGIGGAKEILKHFDWNYILTKMDANDLIQIKGFAIEKVKSVMYYLQDNRELVKDIILIGFNIIHEELVVKESSITGMKICFSGKMKNNRTEMQNNAKSLGATIVSVNSKTDLLVCGEKVGTNKINAAEKFNVKTITEEEYYELID